MAVSCKNNSNETPAQSEEIYVQIPEAIMNQLDSIACLYNDLAKNYEDFKAEDFDSERGKIAKEYFLDPKTIDTLLTKSQKINALAILECDRTVAQLYGMPVDEMDAALIKLAIDTGYPLSLEECMNMTNYNWYTQVYEAFVKSDQITFYWQYIYGWFIESSYILSIDPDYSINSLSDERFEMFKQTSKLMFQALMILKDYNPEVAKIISSYTIPTYQDIAEDFTKEFFINYLKEQKESLKEWRNSTLR